MWWPTMCIGYDAEARRLANLLLICFSSEWCCGIRSDICILLFASYSSSPHSVFPFSCCVQYCLSVHIFLMNLQLKSWNTRRFVFLWRLILTPKVSFQSFSFKETLIQTGSDNDGMVSKVCGLTLVRTFITVDDYLLMLRKKKGTASSCYLAFHSNLSSSVPVIVTRYWASFICFSIPHFSHW